MRRSINHSSLKGIVIAMFLVLGSVSCMKVDNSVKYPYGQFPDSVVNLETLNTAYDDYNSSGYQINGVLPLIFSTNRKSLGGQFDLEQGLINISWDQQVGKLYLNALLTTDAFYKTLINTMVTSGNDFGPFRQFNADDGYEYMILTSQTETGGLDLKYCKYLSYYYGGASPVIVGPKPVTLVNTTSDDAYMTTNMNMDTAYFISNTEGNFDIYYKGKPAGKNLGDWLEEAYSPSEKVDSVNSDSDDKCPTVLNKMMVFTSNRPGGFGGYDLYYSVFRNGKWNTPVNMGSRINTAYDEYRPLIGDFPDFRNYFMIFSSNKPGGKGGFDLYFTGIPVPTK
jgi:hypothetical protein